MDDGVGGALAYGHVAGGAGGLDVPQGLHEGGVHQDVAVGDGEMLQNAAWGSEGKLGRGGFEIDNTLTYKTLC